MVSSVGDVFSERLPSLIRVAQRRAQEIPQVHTVKQGPLLVGALLSFTNLDRLDDPIRFGRQKLADILGVTTRTVDRRLVELEQAGLAERVTPRRKVDGRWPVCRLRWTSVAVAAFWPAGRPDRPPLSDSSVTGAAAAARTTLSHRSPGVKKNFENKESGRAGFGQRPVPTPSPDRNDTRGLPPGPLARLVTEHGLRRVQVVTLMGHCKRRRQRLQDVLAVVADRLPGRRGDALMGFLLHCTQLDRDWAAVLKRRHQEERGRAAKTRRARNTARLLDRISLGSWVPGLGQVIDRQGNSIVVQAAGVRSAATGGVVVDALLEHGGWGSLLAARRGRLAARCPVADVQRAAPPDPPPQSPAGAEALRAALQLIKRRGAGLPEQNPATTTART